MVEKGHARTLEMYNKKHIAMSKPQELQKVSSVVCTVLMTRCRKFQHKRNEWFCGHPIPRPRSMKR
jgi:hypothetical protein